MSEKNYFLHAKMTICYVQRITDVFIIYPDQVVNDSAGNYIEETGKVFIYNTHSYTCPKDTGSGW